MVSREKPENWLHRLKYELLNAGFDIKNLHIDLVPSVIVVVKPIRFLEGEVWNRLMAFLQGFGFHWDREGGAWKKGMTKS